MAPPATVRAMGKQPGGSRRRGIDLEGLAQRDRRGLVGAWRNAEAYLREPLPDVVRRALAQGWDARQVAKWILRQTEETADLRPAQIDWLAQQPSPEEFRPPRKPPRRRQDAVGAGGFWEGVRTEARRPRGVSGGLPGLGKKSR